MARRDGGSNELTVMTGTLNKLENPFLDAFARAEELASHGPAWLKELRRAGLEAHQTLSVPNQKNEEWKYTSLRRLSQMQLRAAEPGPAVFDKELPTAGDGAIRVVMVNGRFDRNLSSVAVVPGLRISSLYNAVIENEEFVSRYLGQIAPISEFTFAALNTSLFEDGVVVHLQANATVEPVIELIHVTSGDDMVASPRCLIVVEENASAKIFETFLTDGPGVSVTLPVTEVFISEGANIEHVRLQDESTKSHHIALWQVKQAGYSEYRSYNVSFGAALGRVDQNIYLDGEFVTTRLDGVVIAKGSQVLDNHTRLDHAFPNGNSFEIYKQIIDDEATIVFNGKIFVHQDAQKTDAKQTNQALLLSPGATIDSKPQLEIFADDVKCTHGATVGQLEDTPMFYLRQRGIPEKEAEGILVYAFAAEVLELISVESVRDFLEAKLYEKLSGVPGRLI